MHMVCAPTYRFNFGLGVAYGRGMSQGYGNVERTTESCEDAPQREWFAYRLDDLPLTRSLGSLIPPVAADALDIAGAIYVADRLSPRHDPSLAIPPSERWPRRLSLTIPVRDPGWWNRPAIREGYERLLAFQSDDDWRLAFVRRSPRLSLRPSESQRILSHLRADGSDEIVLYSGGLDSTLGLIESLLSSGDLVIPASVTTNPRSEEVQNRVLRELIRAIGLQQCGLRVARVYANLSGVPRCDQESSQRVRSLLYLTVGAISSLVVGRERVRVAEHGTGAINLLYTPDQLGARTTKAVHPLALAMVSDLLSLATDQLIEVDNRLLWETKGEACRRISDRLVPVVQETVSCDRFPRQDARQPCGSCASCIIRAAALAAAGRADMDRSAKRSFAFDPNSACANWDESQLIALHAIRFQLGEIRNALESPSPARALLEMYPALWDVADLHDRWSLTASEVESRLVRLYTAYLREIEAYFATFARPGWSPPALISEFNQIRLPAAG